MVFEQPQPEEEAPIIEQSIDPVHPNEEERRNFQDAFDAAMGNLTSDIFFNFDLPPRIRQLAVATTQSFLEEIRATASPERYGPDVWEAIALVPQAVADIVMTHQQNYRTAAREPEGVHVMQYSPGHGLEPGSAAETQRTYTVRMQQQVWQFLREHPELPVCGQILLDWVHTIQASDQSSNSTYTEYLERNKLFYEEYTKFMNTNAGTISPVDVDRVASIVRHVAAGATGQAPSVYVGGPGKMDRFERKLFEKMIVDGIKPSRVLAVDALDFSADAARHAQELGIPIEFRKDNFLNDPPDPQEQFDIVLYPWSIWCDVMKRLDVIRGMHATAKRTKPGGIVVIDQPLDVGESSYNKLRAEQAVEHGEEGAIGRSYEMGAGGPKLWKDLNVIGLADLCLTAAQAGLVPTNLPTTVPKLYAFMEDFELHEREHIQSGADGTNTDAMSRPAYHTSGWNRVTIAFRNVGFEEALKQAHIGSSLLHELTRLRVGKPEDGLK